MIMTMLSDMLTVRSNVIFYTNRYWSKLSYQTDFFTLSDLEKSPRLAVRTKNRNTYT